MSGILVGEKLKPSHYKIGSTSFMNGEGGVGIDMLEVEMRIQVQYRDLPFGVMYSVGMLRLIRQSNVDQWLDHEHNDFQNLLIWYLERHAKDMTKQSRKE